MKRNPKIVLTVLFCAFACLNIASITSLPKDYDALLDNNPQAWHRLFSRYSAVNSQLVLSSQYPNRYLAYKEQNLSEKSKLFDRIKNLEAALVLNPNNPQVLVNISQLYSQAGQKDTASTYKAKALELDPEIR